MAIGIEGLAGYGFYQVTTECGAYIAVVGISARSIAIEALAAVIIASGREVVFQKIPQSQRGVTNSI